METGIFIRAQVFPPDGQFSRWEAVDIADPRLRSNDLLRWLAGLDDAAVLRTMVVVREALAGSADG